MNKVVKITIAVLLLAYITGCSTYTVNRYGISANNIEVMRSMDGLKFSVNKFSATNPGLNQIQCRGAGTISTPNKESFESYITAALVSELKIAGIYSESSNIKIDGIIENLDFSSNVGAGKWMFDVIVSDNSGNSYKVKSLFDFSTNWFADKACQQVAQAFVPAVQNLIKDIISHPKFKSLKS
jgi:hypothetical protein